MEDHARQVEIVFAQQSDESNHDRQQQYGDADDAEEQSVEVAGGQIVHV
jgi:hypothetical protein